MVKVKELVSKEEPFRIKCTCDNTFQLAEGHTMDIKGFGWGSEKKSEKGVDDGSVYKKGVEVLTTTSIDGVKWLLESLTQDKGYKCISIRYKTLKNDEIRELSNFNKFEKAVSKHKNNSIIICQRTPTSIGGW